MDYTWPDERIESETKKRERDATEVVEEPERKRAKREESGENPDMPKKRGRPVGRLDAQPRTRRTKAEMEAMRRDMSMFAQVIDEEMHESEDGEQFVEAHVMLSV